MNCPAAIWTASLVVLTACDPTPRTEIIVAVTSDLATGTQIDRVALRVEAQSGRVLEVGADLGGRGNIELPATFALGWTQGPLGPVAVTAYVEFAGVTVVETSVTTEFVREESKFLVLELLAGCIGVTCDADESCQADGCAPVHVAGTTLPDWMGSVPTTDAGDMRDTGDARDAGDAPDTGGGACKCDPDVNGDAVDTNGDGLPDATGLDAALVTDCLLGRSTDCGRADIDCSGSVTACDKAIITCLYKGLGACCETEPACGACCVSGGGCTRDTLSGCLSAGGVYAGSTTECSDAVCSEVMSHSTRLALGSEISCALTGQGAAYCWGRNDVGQLGVGDLAQHNAPTAVGGSTWAFVALAAGSSHMLALRANGQVWAWGSNEARQIAGSGGGMWSDHPVWLLDFTANRGKAVAAGYSHSCAIAEVPVDVDGGVASGIRAGCWGSDAHGQLGSDGSDSSGLLVQATLPTEPVVLTAGAEHTCALLGDGTVSCWGTNSQGQLGTGDGFTDHDTPTEVTAAADLELVHLCAGSAFTCGLSRRGETYCWGDNASGQIGPIAERGLRLPTPTEVQLLTPNDTAAAIACGANHLCALIDDGTIRCQGAGTLGQLGNGGWTSSDTPADVLNIGGSSSRAVWVAAGGAHTCAILEGGDVECWGDNASGELGTGDTVGSASPAHVNGLP